MLAVSLASLSTIFLWRLWKFTSRPWLYPTEPLELPYWLPCGHLEVTYTGADADNLTDIGHTINFWKDSHRLIKSGREHLIRNGRPSTEPFVLSMGPEALVIVTTGHDAEIVFDKTKLLTWEKFSIRLAGNFGIARSQTSLVWHEPTAGEERYKDKINPQNMNLVAWTEALYRQHIFPGESLDIFSNQILHHLDASLHWQRLNSIHASGSKPVALMDFCADILLTELTQALFGQLVYDIQPELTQQLYDFNEDNWKTLVFEYPKFAARRAANAKDSILDAMGKYIQTPEELLQDASEVLRSYVKELKRGGCNDQTSAGLASILLWGVNQSFYRPNYWILAYILHDPRLLASIRSEIAPAFQTPDVNHRHIYESCPRLYAVFNEGLRCSFGSVTTRNVEAPMTMQGKTIRPGSTIMVPIRELHSNAEIFGPHVDQFDADRFLLNKLDKSPYFMPFGGGVTYCPGRFLAKRLSLSFVATMLERFEILIVDKNGVAKGAQALRAPDTDHVTPNMGIMKPVKGQESYIRLLERKRG